MGTISVRLTTKQFGVVMRALSQVSGRHVSDTHPVTWAETQEVLLDAAISASATCSSDDALIVYSRCEDLRAAEATWPGDSDR